VIEETIASLVLSVQLSFVSHNTTGINSILGDSQEEISQLRRIVRQANYRLLQLVRPEHIYLSRTRLPAIYLHEYLVNQEHFSFVRFFHQAASLFLEHPLTMATKWCVFSRTSSELGRLCADPTIQQLLIPPKNKISLSQLKFVDMSSVKSVDVCRRHVDEFAASGKYKIMICVANMSTCAPKLINILRSLISNYLTHLSDLLIVLILHYPPEIQPNYNVTFVDNWNFAYVEDFGAREAAQNDGSDIARIWIMQSFGIPTKISERENLKYFSSRFMEYTKQCCSKFVVPKHVSTSLQFSKPFYTTDNFTTRFDTFQQIFDENPMLLSNIIKTFSDAWSNSLLQTALEEAWENNLSLLMHISNSLQHFLFPLAQHVVTILCSNYALEGILEMQSRRDAERNEKDLELLGD
jgi:hypothetical protein